MRAITHITASAAASAVLAAVAEPSSALGLLLFGGFLDIDHVPRFLSSGLPAGPGPMLRSVFSSEAQLNKKYSVRVGVPGNILFPALHFVELAALLILGGLLSGSGFLAWAGAGVLLHLLMDFRSYPCSPCFFSMTWRLLNRGRLMEAWREHRSRVSW
ncbi:MAG: hypothetical protein AVO35_10570 [Candidatus Aegiribacteria sp. MLS_C]|nr:MAG: hypothetical protein AVO35_10570 [Candidatus Aegiribacteria sp. MLS_C]